MHLYAEQFSQKTNWKLKEAPGTTRKLKERSAWNQVGKGKDRDRRLGPVPPERGFGGKGDYMGGDHSLGSQHFELSYWVPQP